MPAKPSPDSFAPNLPAGSCIFRPFHVPQVDAEKQREALLKIQKMTLTLPPDADVWAVHFEHVLEAVLRALQHEDEKLRELGIACTKDLIRAVPQRFRAFTEHVLLRLLAAGRDPLAIVAIGAEEALELLLGVSDTHRCMAVLVPVVMKESPPTLQLAVRLQSKLVGRFSQLQLLSILPQAHYIQRQLHATRFCRPLE